jgi:hypothetical protein
MIVPQVPTPIKYALQVTPKSSLLIITIYLVESIRRVRMLLWLLVGLLIIVLLAQMTIVWCKVYFCAFYEHQDFFANWESRTNGWV